VRREPTTALSGLVSKLFATIPDRQAGQITRLDISTRLPLPSASERQSSMPSFLDFLDV
jgi:hypothetical protein